MHYKSWVSRHSILSSGDLNHDIKYQVLSNDEDDNDDDIEEVQRNNNDEEWEGKKLRNSTKTKCTTQWEKEGQKGTTAGAAFLS